MAEKKDAVATEKTAKKNPAKKEKGKVAKFFREYKSELKKVTWPTKKQVIDNTILTILFVAIIGLFIWLLDTGFVFLRDWVFELVKNAKS